MTVTVTMTMSVTVIMTMSLLQENIRSDTMKQPGARMLDREAREESAERRDVDSDTLYISKYVRSFIMQKVPDLNCRMTISHREWRDTRKSKFNPCNACTYTHIRI